ncbi:MAG: branched-chain amino acid ABC transporter permease [Omnitrophica WOR_2 bacterium RIFCSPHIGHO2_01_FULL_48_9]|nr:MAG: branched-chain amino acid ABC transporter permease [Omnitrophica WOR_2 bacterium RIFCSPHIGHO2_01_FULL_48_9]
MGYTGLFNLGHAAFFAIGAYVSALLALGLGMPFWVCIIAAALFAALFGFLLGFPTLRLRGDYLALGTLGFAFIVEAVLKNWTDVTRGPLGLPGIPRPELFSSIEMYMLLALVFLAATILITHRIVNSPFGRVLKSIREDETAAQTLGKNTVRYKMIVLTTSAFFAGIAGSLYAHYITFIDPTSFSLPVLILLLSAVIIGGLGNIRGAVAGAFLLILLPEPLRFIGLPSNLVGAGRQMIYAVLVLVILLKRPQGIFGEHNLRGKRK